MLYVSELCKYIELKPAFVMMEDWRGLLAPTEEKAAHVLKNIIYNSLLDYEKFMLHEQQTLVNIPTYKYTFYQDVTDDEKTTKLIPEVIRYVKSGYGTLPSNMGINPWAMSDMSQMLTSDMGTMLNARYWQYQKPTLSVQYQGMLLVRAGCHRPYVLELTNDYQFTKDSRIYFLDATSINFINQLYLNILRHIKFVKDSVQLNSPVQFMTNLDEQISIVQNQCDTFYRTNARTMTMWRK